MESGERIKRERREGTDQRKGKRKQMGKRKKQVGMKMNLKEEVDEINREKAMNVKIQKGIILFL